jgi:hypothetical protein
MLFFDSIVNVVMAIWDYIKHIFQKVLRFTANIVSFFKDPNRLRKLQEDRNKIAVTVKNNLDNGNYNTVNCIFDKTTNEVIDMEECAIGIESEELDEETQNHFGNKPMIVLE